MAHGLSPNARKRHHSPKYAAPRNSLPPKRSGTPKTQTPLMVKAINTRVRKTEFRQFSLNRQVHTFERQSDVAHFSGTRVAYRVATER
jgi:hypothetical protein